MILPQPKTPASNQLPEGVQYTGGPVPYHTHNGTDSPQVTITDLKGIFNQLTIGDLLVWDSTSFINISASTSGFVLTANGTGAIPTYQAQTVSTGGVFGNGADGDITISVNTTLTTDMYYNNLTINDGVILKPGGFRIFVKGTLTRVGTGKIAYNGNVGGGGGNGSGDNNTGTAGAAGIGATGLSSGSLFGSVNGCNGGIGGKSSGGTSDGAIGGTGATGNAITTGIGSTGATGSHGGAGGSVPSGNGGGQGPGGAAGSFTAAIYTPQTPSLLISGHQLHGSTLSYFQVNGQNGGAGGGGSGGNDTGLSSYGGVGGGGGGSGSDGGYVLVVANTLALANNNTIIQALGGDGGKGGNGAAPDNANSGGGGGGGGGSAGNGGVIGLIYHTLSTGTITLDVTTGGAGLGGTNGGGGAQDGQSGHTGNNGKTITIVV